MNNIYEDGIILKFSRKIVQISGNHNGEIIALANDGTCWVFHKNGNWVELPSLPQPDED